MAALPGDRSREQVLEALRNRMLGFARSRTRVEVADDLVQDALVVIATKYASVHALDELVPLAIQTLRFKLNAHWRKEQRRGEGTAVPVEEAGLADQGLDPEASAASAQLRERLARSLRRLDGRCREIFRLKLEGRSFQEIAEILGARSVNTVYSWDLRCRDRLRHELGPVWESHR